MKLQIEGEFETAKAVSKFIDKIIDHARYMGYINIENLDEIRNRLTQLKNSRQGANKFLESLLEEIGLTEFLQVTETSTNSVLQKDF